MDTLVILSVGTVLLCCGCLGLVVVRLSNPFFRGLWWLGGTYALGAAGAGLLAAKGASGDVYILMMTQTMFLLAFVLLHVCLTEIALRKTSLPRLGMLLVVLQWMTYAVVLQTGDALKLCLVNFGLLVSAQVLQSAWMLHRGNKSGIVAPVRFCTVLLLLFAAYNVVRSLVIARISHPLDPHQPNPLEGLTAIVYLGVVLGFGFCVFWMTSAQIRVELEKLANTDPLTKVANRRCFTQWCERELQRSMRSFEPFSLILIDLDHFKQINDRFGHGTGDLALCAVAEKMRLCLRTVDMLGRWGGEEFVILLPGADSDSAQLVAHRLRGSIESLTLSSLRISRSGATEPLPLTVSAGVTTYRGGSDTLESLFSRCDQALYEAKAKGRNRIALARA